MAEIHVQAKRSKPMPVWVWIVAAVLILGVIAYAVLRNKKNAENTVNKANPTSFIQPDVTQKLLC